MKIKKTDFAIVTEAEKAGLVCGMSSAVEPVRTKLNKELSDYFRKQIPEYQGVFIEDEAEEILDSINEYIQENSINQYLLDFPISSGTNVHLVPISKNIQLVSTIVDEYYGDGDYAKYVEVNSFLINDNTTTKDVDSLIEFVHKYIHDEEPEPEVKPSRIDIMVDIETLGKNSDSTIIQISAIAFDIATGEYFGKFNEIADISKNENPLVTDGSTIKWWMNTNHDLLKELLLNGKNSSETVIKDFQKWIKSFYDDTSKNVYLWGNGILFDNKMIQHQMENLGLEYPIFYRNDRDVRTIVDLAATKWGISEDELKEKYSDDSLVAHNAFDDVKYQINLVCGCYKELINKTKSYKEEL